MASLHTSLKKSELFYPPTSVAFEPEDAERQRDLVVSARAMNVQLTVGGQPYNPLMNSAACPGPYTGKHVDRLAAEMRTTPMTAAAELGDHNKKSYVSDYELYEGKDPRVKRPTHTVCLRDYTCKYQLNPEDIRNATLGVVNEFPNMYVSFITQFVDRLFGSSMQKFLQDTLFCLQEAQPNMQHELLWKMYAMLTKQKTHQGGLDQIFDERKTISDFNLYNNWYEDHTTSQGWLCNTLSLHDCFQAHITTYEMLINACRGGATTDANARLLLEYANIMGRQMSEDRALLENDPIKKDTVKVNYDRVVLRVPHNFFMTKSEGVLDDKAKDAYTMLSGLPSCDASVRNNPLKPDSVVHTPMFEIPVGRWMGNFDGNTDEDMQSKLYIDRGRLISGWRWGFGHAATVFLRAGQSHFSTSFLPYTCRPVGARYMSSKYQSTVGCMDSNKWGVEWFKKQSWGFTSPLGDQQASESADELRSAYRNSGFPITRRAIFTFRPNISSLRLFGNGYNFSPPQERTVGGTAAALEPGERPTNLSNPRYISVFKEEHVTFHIRASDQTPTIIDDVSWEASVQYMKGKNDCIFIDENNEFQVKTSLLYASDGGGDVVRNVVTHYSGDDEKYVATQFSKPIPTDTWLNLRSVVTEGVADAETQAICLRLFSTVVAQGFGCTTAFAVFGLKNNENNRPRVHDFLKKSDAVTPASNASTATLSPAHYGAFLGQLMKLYTHTYQLKDKTEIDLMEAVVKHNIELQSCTLQPEDAANIRALLKKEYARLMPLFYPRYYEAPIDGSSLLTALKGFNDPGFKKSFPEPSAAKSFHNAKITQVAKTQLRAALKTAAWLLSIKAGYGETSKDWTSESQGRFAAAQFRLCRHKMLSVNKNKRDMDLYQTFDIENGNAWLCLYASQGVMMPDAYSATIHAHPTQVWPDEFSSLKEDIQKAENSQFLTRGTTSRRTLWKRATMSCATIQAIDKDFHPTATSTSSDICRLPRTSSAGAAGVEGSSDFALHIAHAYRWFKPTDANFKKIMWKEKDAYKEQQNIFYCAIDGPKYGKEYKGYVSALDLAANTPLLRQINCLPDSKHTVVRMVNAANTGMSWEEMEPSARDAVKLKSGLSSENRNKWVHIPSNWKYGDTVAQDDMTIAVLQTWLNTTAPHRNMMPLKRFQPLHTPISSVQGLMRSERFKPTDQSAWSVDDAYMSPIAYLRFLCTGGLTLGMIRQLGLVPSIQANAEICDAWALDAEAVGPPNEFTKSPQPITWHQLYVLGQSDASKIALPILWNAIKDRVAPLKDSAATLSEGIDWHGTPGLCVPDPGIAGYTANGGGMSLARPALGTAWAGPEVMYCGNTREYFTTLADHTDALLHLGIRTELRESEDRIENMRRVSNMPLIYRIFVELEKAFGKKDGASGGDRKAALLASEAFKLADDASGEAVSSYANLTREHQVHVKGFGKVTEPRFGSTFASSEGAYFSDGFQSLHSKWWFPKPYILEGGAQAVVDSGIEIYRTDALKAGLPDHSLSLNNPHSKQDGACMFSMIDAAALAWSSRSYYNTGDNIRYLNDENWGKQQDNVTYWSRYLMESFIASRESWQGNASNIAWELQTRIDPNEAFPATQLGALCNATWDREFPNLPKTHHLRTKVGQIRRLAVWWVTCSNYTSGGSQPKSGTCWIPMPLYQTHYLMQRQGLFDEKKQVPRNPWVHSELSDIFKASYHSMYNAESPNENHQFRDEIMFPHPPSEKRRPYSQYGGSLVLDDFMKHTLEKLTDQQAIHRDLVASRYGLTDPLNLPVGSGNEDDGIVDTMTSFEKCTASSPNMSTRELTSCQTSSFLAYARVHTVIGLHALSADGSEEIDGEKVIGNLFRTYVQMDKCAGVKSTYDSVPFVLGYYGTSVQGRYQIVNVASTLSCMSANIHKLLEVEPVDAYNNVNPPRRVAFQEVAYLHAKLTRKIRMDYQYEAAFHTLHAQDNTYTRDEFYSDLVRLKDEHLEFVHTTTLKMMLKINDLAAKANEVHHTRSAERESAIALRNALGFLKTNLDDFPIDTLRFRPGKQKQVGLGGRDKQGNCVSHLDITDRARLIDDNGDPSSSTMSREAMLLRNLITGDAVARLPLYYDANTKNELIEQQQKRLLHQDENWGRGVLLAALTADELVANRAGLRALSDQRVMTQIMIPFTPPTEPERLSRGGENTEEDQAFRTLSENAKARGVNTLTMLALLQEENVLTNTALIKALKLKIAKASA